MQKFIVRTIVFLIPVILFVTTIEILLRNIPNDYSLKYSEFIKNSSRIEVLILGNSHYYRGVIAEDIDMHAFNLAHVSQTVDLDTEIFNAFSGHLDSLKYIIFGMSYPSLYRSIKEGPEKWRIKNYNLYYNLNLTFRLKDNMEFFSNSSENNLLRIEEFYFHKRKNIQTTRYGDGVRNGKLDKNKFEKKLRKTIERHSIDQGYYSVFSKKIESMVSLATERDIKILFLTTPVHSSYFNLCNDLQLKKMNDFLDSLDRTNTGVYRLNWIQHSDFNNQDFLDADHLNVMGAKKLTQLLNKKLDSIEMSFH